MVADSAQLRRPQPLARSHILSRRRLPTRSGVLAAVCWKATKLLGEGGFTLAQGYDQAVARDSRDSSGRLRFLAFRDAAELFSQAASRELLLAGKRVAMECVSALRAAGLAWTSYCFGVGCRMPLGMGGPKGQTVVISMWCSSHCTC